MTLKEINNELKNLKYTEESLRQAMKKFEGTNNIENYLDYSSLSIALKCVRESMERLENKEWN